MRNTKKYISILIVMIVMGLIVCATFFEGADQYQYLNSIDYQVEMQKDGSMRVTETWDIDIKNTNTLFKNFTISKFRYGDITNVEVIDLQRGKKFKQINDEMYHVTEDYYYALPINSTTFEIAWGVGMDTTTGNRKFQISYTVTDVVTEYNDIQEIYWQFLENGRNAIPAKKVTGTFILPQDVENIDNLKVWGHGQLNGIIERADNHTVKFEMDNLNPGSRLEVRIVTQEKMFDVADNKTRQYSYLPQVMREEQNWADEADNQSKNARIFYVVLAIIYILVVIYYIYKTIKYYKLSKKDGDGLIYNDIKYFRDIPREDATPAEACYLYNFDKKRLDTGIIQNQAVSSTILDLCLKKVISLRVKQDEVYVKILRDKDGLPNDEQEIYDLLSNTGQGREEFLLSDLNLYAKDKYNQYSYIINKMVNSARNRLYNLRLLDKANEKEYIKCENAGALKAIVLFLYIEAIVIYLLSLIPMFKINVVLLFGMEFQKILLIILMALFPLVAIVTYSWKLKSEVKNKIAVLTQEGLDEKTKWIALRNFMMDFSLLNEKGVVDLILWEKYLVYATAFGISDKVIEQMKAVYPEVFVKEQWSDETINEYPVIYFSTYSFYNGTVTVNAISNLNNNVRTAYSTSRAQISAHSSSSNGGGGGFSGGGGGRRRRRPEWAEDKVVIYYLIFFCYKTL